MSINRRFGVPMASAGENDALSPRSRRLRDWRPGVRKAMKKLFNRRLRRVSIAADLHDYDDPGDGAGVWP